MDDSIQRYPLLRLLVAYLLGVGIAHAVYPMADAMMLSRILLPGAVLTITVLAVCVVVNRGSEDALWRICLPGLSISWRDRVYI